MSKKRLSLILALALGIASCATPTLQKKEWEVMGGSRTDGTVKLSYQYQNPDPSTERTDFIAHRVEEGIELAKSKCVLWGYSDAKPFGGAIKACMAASSRGCHSWLVTAEYHCLGNPRK